LLGVPKKRIAKQLGFDVKTVRRYLAAARAQGADAGHGLGALDDALVAAVVKVTQPETDRPRGEGWAVCETHREFIAGHLANRVRLSKVSKLLRRRGVDVGYDRVRRYAVEHLNRISWNWIQRGD
jgi:transposase